MAFCADRAHGTVGAARRRRDRRLRAFLEHERMTVAMNLATIQRHSYLKSGVVNVGVQAGSPLAPVTEYVAPAPVPPVYSTTTVNTDLVYPQFSSTAVEPYAPCVVGSLPPVEEFSVPVYAHVHFEQIAASEMTVDTAEIPVVHQQVIVGMRPERLVDARGPQRCDRTVPSVGAPVLAVQSLRGFDGVDDTTAKFLLRQALKLKKEEEEEKERKVKEMQEMEEDKKAKTALAAWTARRKAVTDEMHALLDISPLTPAWRRREVWLIRELGVIDAAMPLSSP